jgi:hypothetical protein
LPLFFREFRLGPSAMRQRGNIATLALLAQQFVNEGFVHAEQIGDLALAPDLPLHGLHDSFSQV